jgi:neuropeptide Y receptor
MRQLLANTRITRAQVIFKPKILSPRNIFIVNLAGSDLLLCVFTMPLTFIEVSMKIWQMGEFLAALKILAAISRPADTPRLTKSTTTATEPGLIPCKLVAGLQATSIFVSTISITAIALDRYKVIVYPTHQETASGTRGALLLLASVWIGALSLSLPLFTYRTVEHHEITSRK